MRPWTSASYQSQLGFRLRFKVHVMHQARLGIAPCHGKVPWSDKVLWPAQRVSLAEKSGLLNRLSYESHGLLEMPCCAVSAAVTEAVRCWEPQWDHSAHNQTCQTRSSSS